MQHAVIMAGGAGTRMWPLSRRQRPKHFLKLIGGKSLLRSSFDRLVSFLPPEQINVITSAAHLDLVAEEIPELPPENLIGEPAVRDTANAVGLSAFILHERDPEGVMGIFTADHIIKPVDRYKAALERAYAAAAEHQGALVTLGINPTEPHTGFGYVQRGRALSDGVFEVSEFKEKPDLETATRYLASGEYYWNSGMFVWRIQAILEQFKKHLPDNFKLLSRLRDRPGAAGSSPRESRDAIIAEIYPELPKISIDYGVMEKADQVILCEMDCDWLDVGSWTSLEAVIAPDSAGNIGVAENFVALDSNNNVFVSEDDHLLAAVGLKDIVVVHSRDATLICRKEDVQKIKDLVGQLHERYL